MPHAADDVHGTSFFDVLASAVEQMRQEGWTGLLAPTAIVRVEVQLAPVVCPVPLQNNRYIFRLRPCRLICIVGNVNTSWARR